MALPEKIMGEYNSTNINEKNDVENTIIWSTYLNKINNVDQVNQTNNNNKRHIELNEYAISKYKAQTLLLKKIIIICCIALIGSYVFYLNFISKTFYTIYLGIVFGIGLIIVMYDLFDIFMRSSYNFNEYDFEFIYKPPSIQNIGKNYNTIQLSNLPTTCK
jgi:hypothetical protein